MNQTQSGHNIPFSSFKIRVSFIFKFIPRSAQTSSQNTLSCTPGTPPNSSSVR